MKPVFIKYQNLGKNLKNNDFTIYSDKGVALPSGLNSDQLLAGSIVQIPDDASKVFVTPGIYDLIASGNSIPQLSGLRFAKNQNIQISIPGLTNYDYISSLSGFGRTNSSLDSASLNEDGTVIIVGSTQTFLNGTGIYIYTRTGNTGNWNLKQTILHPANPGFFGRTTAINNNGSLFLTTSNDGNGYLFIYTGSSNNGWNLKQVITGSGSRYGFFSAINGSGNIIAVSAGFQDNSTSERKIYIYTGNNTSNWSLKQVVTGNFGFNFGHLSINNDGSTIVASDGVQNNRAFVYTGYKEIGWRLANIISGNLTTTSINEDGSIILLNNYFNDGSIKIYTGDASKAQWVLKQTISGDFNASLGRSSKITNNMILASAPNIGKIYLYTGSKNLGWSSFKEFQEDQHAQFGGSVDINKNGEAIATLRIPRVGDGGSYTASINFYSYTSKTGIINYISNDKNYGLWRNPVMRRWIISDYNRIGLNLTSPVNSFITPENGSLQDNFNGTANWEGNINITQIDNKLRVYNTPGITGFAGTYTSGTFMIQGTPRVGFQNDQNPNFYIYKNDSPSAWRAVEYPADYAYTAFTWYSRTGTQGVQEDQGEYPQVDRWRLGDNSVMRPPPVTDEALPLPEMNFGHCAGNTLIYPIYTYQADSSDPTIDNIKFYPGGVLSSSGTSDLFSENLSIIFPNLINVYFDKQFFYTNLVKGSRYLLFKSINNKQVDNFYITKTLQNYNSGYFYWEAGFDYVPNTGINTLQQARKVYTPVGNNISGLKNISINLNPLYLNQKFGEESDLQLATLNSGDNIYIDIQPNISGFENIDNIYKYTVVDSIPQTLDTVFSKNISTPFTGINNANLFNINPTGNIADIITNKPIVIRVSGNWRNTSAEWLSSPDQIDWENFLLTGSGNNRINSLNIGSGIFTYSGFAPYQYLKIQNITGANRSGNINVSITYSTPDPSQNTGLFHCLSGENYIFASPQFNISEARCWQTGTNIWSVLDSEFNYVGIQNCATNSGVLPSKYWFTGVWSWFIGNRFSNLRFTKLYSHNPSFNFSGLNEDYILDYKSDFNPALFSGLQTGTKGKTFIFTDSNIGLSLTGTITAKSTGFIGGVINSNTTQTLNISSFQMRSLSGNYVLSIIYNDFVYEVLYTGGNNANYTKYSLLNSEYSCNFN